MQTLYKSLFFIGIVLILTNCEDAIDVKTDFKTPELAVDAWIDNTNAPQTITLTESQNYFDNRLPTPVTDATVQVSNGTATYDFTYIADGKYTWTPTGPETLGTVDDELTLNISSGDKSYTASSTIHRVPEIDSISLVYDEGAPRGGEDGVYAEVYAKDLPGQGDAYWIRSYVNDTLLNRPRELNLSYDGTFERGTSFDNRYFIFPIRRAINRVDEDSAPQPLVKGDKIQVDILSISDAAFDFLKIVQEQTTNGDNTIFALPVANARSNINVSDGSTGLGFFNVAAKSTMTRIVE